MTLFEKMVVLLMIMFLFILFGVGSFYFKRRIHNMEVAIKDQASVTHNILGMMNTFTRTSSHKPQSDVNINDARSHLDAKELSSNADDNLHSIPSFHENAATMAISDILMGAPNYNSGASFMKMGGIEIMGVCSLGTGAGVYSSNESKGRIVVTDSDDDANVDVIEELNEELNVDEGRPLSIMPDDAELSDIDAEEPDVSKDEPTNKQEPKEVHDSKTESPSVSPPVSNSDAYADAHSIENDATHVSYDKMKVTELRELLESKGHSMTKMKQLKKAELIQLATTNVAPSKETSSMTLDLSEPPSQESSVVPDITEESITPIMTREVEE